MLSVEPKPGLKLHPLSESAAKDLENNYEGTGFNATAVEYEAGRYVLHVEFAYYCQVNDADFLYDCDEVFAQCPMEAR